MNDRAEDGFSAEELERMRFFLRGEGQSGVWSSLRVLADRAAGAEPSRGAASDANAAGKSNVLADINLSRRRLLEWIGGVSSLLAAPACTRQPPELIVPYARAPENIIPGEPLYYTTAMPFENFGIGLLAESHMGRPTKIEGNDYHPASLGATDAYAQASVLTLYDPDRARAVTQNNRVSSWDLFTVQLQEALKRSSGRQGSVRILTPTVTSPSLADQLQRALALGPHVQWHQYDPIGFERSREGTRLAFGRPLNVVYNLFPADVIVSLGADFVLNYPGKLRYLRQFAARRDPQLDHDPAMNRLYCVHATPNLTGAVADHSLIVRPSEIEELSYALAAALKIETGRRVAPREPIAQWVQALASDLIQHRGRSLIMVDETQSAEVHALALAMNEALGNFGKTVFVTEPVEARVETPGSVDSLAEAMHAGQVEVMLLIDSNPVYNAPADLNFAAALRNVPFKAQLSLYQDETTPYCTWHAPETHFLEAWGDIRAFDGTVTIQQPLIEPLYECHSALEFMATVLGQRNRKGYDIVREYWQGQIQTQNLEALMRRWLELGIVEGTSFPVLDLQPKVKFPLPGATRPTVQPPFAAENLELAFQPDPSIWDGRFANNAWLQELPKPISKLTWDNAALVSPRTAARLELVNTDVVRLSFQGRQVEAPIFIVLGQADDTVTLTLGYGRRGAGRIAENHGYDAYQVRPSRHPWFGPGLSLQKTGRNYLLATTQEHHQLYDRNIIRRATLEAYLQDPAHLSHAEFSEPRFQPTIPVDPAKIPPAEHAADYQWGMVIDINKCLGCNACVVACQAENNIPVVGKEGVARGREMHWLRIDSYFGEDVDKPEVYFQPMLCQHCETAPCELVCPVNATSHSQDGLSQMVYNRCVGTRYCSNNCPYKVRYFNFFDYTNPSLVQRMVYNPDVTVRSRGVMEKCSFCIQRISEARIDAKVGGGRIQPDQVKTACQQACPTNAIVFGNIKDPKWEVARLKTSPRNYSVLGELNTKPRTTYLARIKNVYEKLKPSKPRSGDTHG